MKFCPGRLFSGVVSAAMLIAQVLGAEAAEEKAISVGVSSIESGNAAFFRDMGQGFNYYLQYRNANGGIAGYKLDVEVLDNQLTPPGGAQTVRQFIADDKFLIMIVGSPSANGAFGILEQRGQSVPVISMGATDIIKKLRSQGKLSNIFGMFPNNDRGVLFDLKYLATNLGQKKIALVYEDSAVGQSAGAVAPKFGESLGVQVDAIPVAPTSTNFGPIAARLKDSGATAVDVVARAGILAGLQKAAAAIGYHPVWMTYAANFSTSYLDIAGEAAEGTYFAAFLEPLSSSSQAVTTFKREVVKYDPKAVNELAQAGWAVGEVVAAAIDKATDQGKEALTREGFMNALNTFGGQNVGMVLGVGYTEADHSTIAAALSVYQVKNGKFEKVADPSPVPEL